MIYTSLAAFIISLGLIPLIFIFCKKFNVYDSINARKIHTGKVPRLGGVAIFISFSISFFVYIFTFSTSHMLFPVFMWIGAFMIFVMGVLDDFINLRARLKFLIQCTAAFIVVSGGYRFKQILFIQVPPLVGQIFTFFWIVGVINAFNLIDGLDWLCSGISFLIFATLHIVFARSAVDYSAICLILSCSIAGFMVYNKPPAKIFLGDGGSQFLGYFAAVCPLFYSTLNYEYNKFLIMLVLASIPLTDTIAAIWRRTREHRSIFSPDKAHVHHKLMNIGLSKKGALGVLLGIQVLICLSVGLAMYLKTFEGTVLLLLSFAFILLIFSTLHYINRAVNCRINKEQKNITRRLTRKFEKGQL